MIDETVDEEMLRSALRVTLLILLADNEVQNDKTIDELESQVKEKLVSIMKDAGENPFELISGFTASLVSLFVETSNPQFTMTVLAAMGMMAEMQCMFIRGELSESYLNA
jgi:hypothetical protein